MTMVTHPPKQLVRSYMLERVRDRTPPPAPQDIRRQLGWELIHAVTPSLRGGPR